VAAFTVMAEYGDGSWHEPFPHIQRRSAYWWARAIAILWGGYTYLSREDAYACILCITKDRCEGITDLPAHYWLIIGGIICWGPLALLVGGRWFWLAGRWSWRWSARLVRLSTRMAQTKYAAP
jgi:hypothetical protein